MKSKEELTKPLTDESSDRTRQQSSPTHPESRVVIVYFLPPNPDAMHPVASPGVLRLFLRDKDLPLVFGSTKVAAILAKSMTPIIRRRKMTLYSIGEVLVAADDLRAGRIKIDFAAGTVKPGSAQG